MIYAIVNNEKVEAKTGLKGKCQICDDDLFPRCGEIKVHHWAHYKGSNCDNWYEPETNWHYHWKKTFGKDYSEVVIENYDEKHIADIYTRDKLVIQLQKSIISSKRVLEKEKFFGEKMLWLINGIEIKDRFNFYFSIKNDDPAYIKSPNEKSDIYNYNIKYARKSWINSKKNIFFDFGDNDLFWCKTGNGVNGEGVFIPKKYFIVKYGGDYEYYQDNLTI